MDTDLPAEPNDYMAAAYAELAHQARLRTNSNVDPDVPGVELQEVRAQEAADRLDNLARLYSMRRELTTGYRP